MTLLSDEATRSLIYEVLDEEAAADLYPDNAAAQRRVIESRRAERARRRASMDKPS